jgi:predicted ATPase/class 3 adenylate cyclase
VLDARGALPTGRVAFLFSDVEASTRRWERYGELMRDALRRHDIILRTAIESRGGYVFKTIGDAFCAAFSTAIEALDAATEAQRRLGTEDFSAVDGLRVRMAIHAGETDERSGDYFGSAVNRTARLLSAANGGQLVLSAFAAELALPRLPAGITLRNLGTVPLRDIKEPERVYQAVGAGLSTESKPLRALETPPNNLPRQSTSFVGRHDDLARVEALLDKGAVVTIVGAGGIGKTRLALEIAANRLNDERDGAWFADLSAVGDPALIAGTILSAVGGEASPGGEPLEDLLAYLERRELLLILDNSEHLVSAAAAVVARIVARCRHVTILATSRQPLDITSERLYRLDSLDLQSATELFVDRARAANPAFVAGSKAAAIEDICTRLDGIALAIELAAARTRTMSVENVASHLELRLLAGGRDRRPRQQTMRALIDWSYDLLSEEEQETLRRAGVFLRGFTPGAAAAVCGSGTADEWRVLDLLGSLVDKSLVLVDDVEGGQRYRVLEPIREYAWDKLTESGEVEATRRKHAAAIASLARGWYEEWDRGPAADWLARLERDLANLRAALRWSVAESTDLHLGTQLAAYATIVFLRLALLAEGIAWSTAVLQAESPFSDDLEAQLRYGMSMLYSSLGESAKCLAEAEKAVELFRRAGDIRGLARALSQVASRYGWQSRNAEAKVAAEEALGLARDTRDPRLLADVLRRCAVALANDGPDRVRATFAESIALSKGLGRDDDTTRTLSWWGQWEAGVGNYPQAIDRLLEAARLDIEDSATMFYSVDVAGCYLAIGDRERAEPFARKGLVAAAKAGYAISVSLAISHLAIIVSETDLQRAARLIGYAERRFADVGWELSAPEDALVRDLRERLRERFRETELGPLFSEGAAWSDDQAVAHALSF